jgi:hypothetical protein
VWLRRIAAAMSLLAGAVACGTRPASRPLADVSALAFAGQPCAVRVEADGTIRITGLAYDEAGGRAFLATFEPGTAAERRVSDAPFPDQVWLGGVSTARARGTSSPARTSSARPSRSGRDPPAGR